VRVLGPNCIGVYNAFNGLDTMFLPAEKAGRPPPGPIAFLSQSGAVMTAVLDWAAGEGIGVGLAVNFGNRSDVTESDSLRHLGRWRRSRPWRCISRGLGGGATPPGS
jgi:acyl-CoA synthetase (NDP forming)